MSVPSIVLPIAQDVAAALASSEDFAELLACLPDDFFYQSQEQQQNGWKIILAQVVRGERDFEKVARNVGVEQ